VASPSEASNSQVDKPCSPKHKQRTAEPTRQGGRIVSPTGPESSPCKTSASDPDPDEGTPDGNL